jgi:hypothetical protein
MFAPDRNETYCAISQRPYLFLYKLLRRSLRRTVNLWVSFCLIIAASKYNPTKNLDRAPIQVILTDCLLWSFYYLTSQPCQCGEGLRVPLGYRSNGFNMIILSSTEIVHVAMPL